MLTVFSFDVLSLGLAFRQASDLCKCGPSTRADRTFVHGATYNPYCLRVLFSGKVHELATIPLQWQGELAYDFARPS